MSNYKIILFDLDGTLSDPKMGITKAVQYALSKFGIQESNLEQLTPFIGPPLQESFAKFYGLNLEQVIAAVQYYREYFTQQGMFENELYPEIPNLLRQLKAANKQLVVATSKPTVFAEQILAYFKIQNYFENVVGSELDGTRTAKTDIINYIFTVYPSIDKEDFIMIGDREHDVIGANNAGIDSIGVTYGYGSWEELSHSSPTYICKHVKEVGRILLV